LNNLNISIIEINWNKLLTLGIGDWGLGIGPIPNPQSPIPNILTL